MCGLLDCRLLSEAGVPSALTGAPRVNRAVCACCAQPAMLASRLRGLPSSCMQSAQCEPRGPMRDLGEALTEGKEHTLEQDIEKPWARRR